MAHKCENKNCTTGKAADIILHLPTKVLGGMIVDREPLSVCASCARTLWKNDPGIFRGMTRTEEVRAVVAAMKDPQPAGLNGTSGGEELEGKGVPPGRSLPS